MAGFSSTFGRFIPEERFNVSARPLVASCLKNVSTFPLDLWSLHA
jgi:hypothetical protein